MTKIFIFILFFFTNLFGIDNEKKIIVGAERIDQYKDLIKGKSIALLVNHTSVVKGVHLIDTLSELGYNINKIFSPEHGFRGTIERGKKVLWDILEMNDKKNPIVSMY